MRGHAWRHVPCLSIKDFAKRGSADAYAKKNFKAGGTVGFFIATYNRLHTLNNNCSQTGLNFIIKLKEVIMSLIGQIAGFFGGGAVTTQSNMQQKSTNGERVSEATDFENDSAKFEAQGYDDARASLAVKAATAQASRMSQNLDKLSQI